MISALSYGLVHITNDKKTEGHYAVDVHTFLQPPYLPLHEVVSVSYDEEILGVNMYSKPLSSHYMRVQFFLLPALHWPLEKATGHNVASQHW